MTAEVIVKETMFLHFSFFLVEKLDGQYVWIDNQAKQSCLKMTNPVYVGDNAIIENLLEETVLIEPGIFAKEENR